MTIETKPKSTACSNPYHQEPARRRHRIQQAVDVLYGVLATLGDEGDRVYLGSTNDVDLLRSVIAALEADTGEAA